MRHEVELGMRREVELGMRRSGAVAGRPGRRSEVELGR